MAPPLSPNVGQVAIRARVNLRSGAPDTSAPIIGRLEPGATIPVEAVVTGQAVQGDAQWYRTTGNAYVWAGACGPLQSPTPAAVGRLTSSFLARLDQTPLVVDLFHGDGVTSFADAKSAGLVGVIHKATTGASGRDDAYPARRTAAGQVGLLWGAYHWGTAAPVDQQVQNFLSWANPDAATLVALDFEQTPGDQMTVGDARAFLGALGDKLGRKPVIYGGDRLKSELGSAPDPFFGSHRLWLADYSATPTLPPSWSSFFLWQYTDGVSGPGRKTAPGLPGNRQGQLDCDFFAGEPQVLAATWARAAQAA